MRNKSEKPKKKKRRIGSAVAEGFLELTVELVGMVLAFGLGYLLINTFYKDKLPDIDGEVVMLLGLILLTIPAGLVIVIVAVTEKYGGKKMKPVYRALKKKYPLKRANLTRKVNGEYLAVYAVVGSSQRGSFELYCDAEEFIFVPKGSNEIRLPTADDAIATIEQFMA